MIMQNTLRDKLNEDRPTVGTHVLFADPDIPELIKARKRLAELRDAASPTETTAR